MLSCGRLPRPAHRPLHHSSRLAKIHEVGAGNEFNYEEVARSFQWEVPARFNFSRDVMDRWAEAAGTRPALWWVEPQSDQEVKLSFSEVSDATQRAAAALAGLGVTRAVCILPRVPEWWIINLATVRAGIVLLPGTTQLTPRDIAGRLLSSAADCVICDPETAVKVDGLEREAVAGVVARIVVGGERPGWMTWNKLYHAAPATHTAADTAASDTMQIYFTSGTTGKPKMVGHTHGSYGFCHWPMGKYWLDLTPEDLMWNISDTGWAKSAWSTIFGPWSQGATVFIHGMPRFTGPAVLDCLTRYPVSVLCAPPTLYRSLVQADLTSFSPAHLRHCVSAGEPLNEEVIYSWEEATGLVIKEGYGQTETTLLIGTFKVRWNLLLSLRKIFAENEQMGEARLDGEGGSRLRRANRKQHGQGGGERGAGEHRGPVPTSLATGTLPGEQLFCSLHHPAATMALHSSLASAGRLLFIGLQLPPQLADILSLSLYERDERQVDLTVSHNSRSRHRSKLCDEVE